MNFLVIMVNISVQSLFHVMSLYHCPLVVAFWLL